MLALQQHRRKSLRWLLRHAVRLRIARLEESGCEMVVVSKICMTFAACEVYLNVEGSMCVAKLQCM
jgi:hypothetical protein